MEFIMRSTILAGLAITLLGLPGCFQAENDRPVPEKANNDDPIVQLLKDNQGNAVIMFHKPGCPFSAYMEPIFNRVMQDYKDTLFMKQITVTPHTQSMFKRKYGFSTFPTVIYFKDHKAVKQHGSAQRTYKEGQIKGHIKDIYDL